jgi:hypothetical protein
MFDRIKECFILAIPQQKSGNKINFYKGNKMKKLNLIAAALAGVGFGLLFIGAAENIFNLTEVLIGGAVCCAAFVYSISSEV